MSSTSERLALNRQLPCWVYRVYDELTAELLYIGRTKDPETRIKVHSNGRQDSGLGVAVLLGYTRPDKWRASWARYPTGDEADSVELHAIDSEHPKFNGRGRYMRAETNRRTAAA